MKTTKKVMVTALALGVGLGGGVAWAGSWGSYDAAFPTRPCHDGWMGCVVEGTRIEPTMATDSAGLPVPSNMRVGWHDLKATAAFSPFVGLSDYQIGSVAAVAEVVPDGENSEGSGNDGAAMVEASQESREAEAAAEQAAVEATARKAASADARRQQEAAAQASREAEAEARRIRQEEEAMRRQAEQAAAAATQAQAATKAAEKQRLAREADDAARRAADAQAAREAADEAARQAAAEEQRRSEAAAQEAQLQAEAEAAREAADEEARRQAEADRQAREAETARLAAEAEAQRLADAERLAAEQAARDEQARLTAAAEGGDADATAMLETPAPPPAAVADGDCSDIVAMEPTAMLGKLSEGQVGCLEGRITTAAKMTDKEKISRVLMVNAYSKGDKQTWESLVKRHLDEIDQSDPDLCYKYALHLSRLGPGRASGVIRWANVALENRMVWTADTYTSRVYSLYKLRAAASQSLWKKAEEDHATAPSDETSAKVDKYRAMTKVNAREWYEYAKDAGKDTTKALQLCMSAAGTADYCEAG